MRWLVLLLRRVGVLNRLNGFLTDMEGMRPIDTVESGIGSQRVLRLG